MERGQYSPMGRSRTYESQKKCLSANRPKKGTDGAQSKSEEAAVLHEGPNDLKHRQG